MLARSRAPRPRQLRQLCRLRMDAAPLSMPAASRAVGTLSPSRCFSSFRSRSIPLLSLARPFSTTPLQRYSAAPLPNFDRITALVAGARDRLLSHPGIPPENEIATALRICAEAADLVMETAPHVTADAPSSSSSLSSSASHAAGASLLELDGGTEPRRLVVDCIADAAFAIVDDPRVFLTAALLAQYVHIQARLGRPESLPRILEAYATRPVPRSAGRDSSVITYKSQNPRDVRSAVSPDVADAALDTAIAAKSLDAAVGVVEWTYAAPAFARYKLLRRGLLPGFVVVGLPMATYIAASHLAAYQQTMDTRTATGLAFAAILSYIGFTGAIGVVANATANDQMRRVTWAPGTALRERWLREEERLALDKVACAFGFSEPHRYGEEEGAEFQALREYILSKGMLMDQVELMEGMSS